MKEHLLPLYHALPYSLKVAAATAWGYYLRWWRYGPETEHLVAEALERETWSAEKWKSWQEDRLAYILHRAVTKVPYYRQLWAQRRQHGDSSSWEYLENWLILEKEPLRQHPAAFVADDCHRKKMFESHTTGTTGTPVRVWLSQATLRAWYALFEARWRRWYGVSFHDRWAHLGGQLVTSATKRQPPFWAWNSAFNQLYMSSYHLAPDLIPYYLDALKKYKIKYLFGYPSSLYPLALEALRPKDNSLKMTVALTDGEPLFDYQRQTIAAAFQCPAYETYGMAETAIAASECGAQGLHLWPEAGILEVFEKGCAVAQGHPGDFILTSLLNPDMPLIRYRVGDRGALLNESKRCLCGRSLPRLASLEGRSDDVLYTVDGRKIGLRLSQVLKGQPVVEGQFIQESLTKIRLRYVPAADFTDQAAEFIIAKLQERMGPVEVIFEPVGKIPRGPNGKFRAVVCNLSSEEKEKLQGSH
ncbi:MAG: phenylacetate--CoA ligase family protein [Desulfobacteraceae bacterium]